MAKDEQMIARLKELMRISKMNGLAKTQVDFAEFIGSTRRTVQDALSGIANTENAILLAEDALERAGIHVKNEDTVEKRLKDIERKVATLERAVFREIKDETL